MLPISAPNRAAFRGWIIATAAPMLLALLYFLIYPDPGRELLRLTFWTIPFGLFVGLLMRAAAWPTLVGASALRRGLILLLGLGAGLVFAAVAGFPYGAWAGPFFTPVALLWALAGVMGALYVVVIGVYRDIDTPAAAPVRNRFWNAMRWAAPFGILIAMKSALVGVTPFDYSQSLSISLGARYNPATEDSAAAPVNTPPAPAAVVPDSGVLDSTQLAAPIDAQFTPVDVIDIDGYGVGVRFCPATCAGGAAILLLQGDQVIDTYAPAAGFYSPGPFTLESPSTPVGIIRLAGTLVPDATGALPERTRITVTILRAGNIIRYSRSHEFTQPAPEPEPQPEPVQ